MAMPRLRALRLGAAPVVFCVPRIRWLPLLGACLGFALPAVADVGLDEIRQVADSGAPALALQLLDRRQPSFDRDAQGWQRMEELRLLLYRQREDAQALAARLETYPSAVPLDFRRRAGLQHAALLLDQRRGEAARAALQRLIWLDPIPPPTDALAAWRQLIVRSYFLDNRTDEALTAVRRYEQDHSEKGRDWMLLRARVLIQAGQPREALKSLSTLSDAEARALVLLAELRAKVKSAEAIAEAAAKLAAQPELKPELKALLRCTAAEGIGAKIPSEAKVEALERTLGLRAEGGPDESLCSLRPDVLWDAYGERGRVVMREAKLAAGDAAGAMALAQRAVGPGSAAKARALYARVALEAREPDRRAEAHRQLAQRIGKLPRGFELLKALYLESTRFSTVDAIPGEVRHLLIDAAIAQSNLSFASDLAAGLERGPSGLEAFEWRLRRARIHVLAGDEREGLDSLRAIFKESKQLSTEQLDRLMQVLFDMQKAGQHAGAYELFQRILERKPPLQTQREILYWMADSMKAIGNHAEAARLYLRSATLTDTKAMDLWAQSARFQAAEMLAAAGLGDDARKLYQGLLKVTEDPNRGAMLQNTIDRLGVKQ